MLIIFIPLLLDKNFLLMEKVDYPANLWDSVNVFDWALSFYRDSKKPLVDFLYPYMFQIYFYRWFYPGNLFFALKSVFKQSYKNLKLLIIYDNINKKDLKKIKFFLKKKKYFDKFNKRCHSTTFKYS